MTAASILGHSVKCLRLQGVEARGLVLQAHPYEDADGVETFIPHGARRQGAAWTRGMLAASRRFVELLRWADVVHWHGASRVWPAGLDLRLVHAMGKPAVVQWYGSDIRSASREAADNPVWRRMLEAGEVPPAYRLTDEESRRRQARFHAAGFAMAVPPGMEAYVDRSLAPRCHTVMLPVPVHAMVPAYPSPSAARPKVVHIPSNPVVKGSRFVDAAVAEVARDTPLHYEALTGLPREEALRRLAQADVVLDQFALGAHGVLALEAMALGKPVVCYIKPSLRSVYPADLPIVPAAPDELAGVLRGLLRDGRRRHEVGKASRAYVERHHSFDAVGRRLVEVYRAELALRGKEVP